MDLKVTIEGLGKISKGHVNLQGFTLLAGRNSTGKTLVSKVIYSALKGANSNHAWNLIGDEVETLHKGLSLLQEGNENLPPVLEELADLTTTPPQFFSFLGKEGIEYAQGVRDIASDIDHVYRKEDREKMIKDFDASGSFRAENEVRKMEEAIDKIKDFAKLSWEDVVRASIREKMNWFFIENFGIGRLAKLAMESSKGFKININGCLEIESKQDQFSAKGELSSEIADIPSLLFVDSVGLRVHGRLIRELGSLRSSPRMIPEIPAYHTNLLNILEAINLIPDKSLDSISEEIAAKIGGKLQYDNGSLNFHEDGVGVLDASITSSGILQLGLLGLILEKGLLREGSILFIDAPETNLHPAWQVSMTGMLCRLAVESKVNIVLATYSPYILQYLRYGAMHDDKFDKILSVHHFADKGINVGSDEMENYQRIEQIEEDLNEIYMDIFLKGETSA